MGEGKSIDIHVVACKGTPCRNPPGLNAFVPLWEGALVDYRFL